jgi:hypothetical protein
MPLTPTLFAFAMLDLIVVKGKKKPVQVYEVLELTGVAQTRKRQQSRRTTLG